nr:MAG TPA: hypothetical protein [Caudoviricetes sp.]DAS11442.1 MAG TPA: hypothetical protein [Caudoviricetes sp.]
MRPITRIHITLAFLPALCLSIRLYSLLYPIGAYSLW